MNQKINRSRREFLKNSTLGIFGAGVLRKSGLRGFQEDKKPPSLQIKDYRTLGRTGFKVSDLACGFIREPGILEAMLDAGVNYIDTAESYGTHEMIGKVIKGRDRKSLFLTTKMEIKKDVSKEGFLKRARRCLEELHVDYVDCMMMHMPETVETLKTEGFHEAMAQLKSEGRIRFVGVSNHGSFWYRDPEQSMERVLLAAVEDGRFDIFLMAYNFLQMDQAEKVLRVCRKKRIGTVLMKTTPVKNYYGLKQSIEKMREKGKDIHELYIKGLERFKKRVEKAERFIEKYDLQNPEEIKEAAVRFVLSNPDVNTACCSVRNFDELERTLSLSGTTLSNMEKKKLAAYKEGCGELYCRHACGVCEPQCPHHVPVNTIMRYHHYFEAQGREKYAMLKYKAIPGAKAEVCGDCPGYCEKACPYNVPIQPMLLMAHQQLSLA